MPAPVTRATAQHPHFPRRLCTHVTCRARTPQQAFLKLKKKQTKPKPQQNSPALARQSASGIQGHSNTMEQISDSGEGALETKGGVMQSRVQFGTTTLQCQPLMPSPREALAKASAAGGIPGSSVQPGWLFHLQTCNLFWEKTDSVKESSTVRSWHSPFSQVSPVPLEPLVEKGSEP